MRLKSYTHLSRACCLLALAAAGSPALADTTFEQTNLVSDIPGMAAHTDANLANPWGIDWGGSSPFWISNNKSGTSTLYSGSGVAFPVGKPLVVTIPGPGGPSTTGAPTGVVFSGSAHFIPDAAGKTSVFLFATEDGTIAGWGQNTTSAVLRVNNSASGAVYKGLAISSDANTSLLYAANFNSGHVDTFNSSFAPTTLTGSFADPNIPSGFAPFNIENIDGQLLVTYAKQDAAKHDDVSGVGNGFIDIFNTNGTLSKRLVSADPHLNSPWGMAIAPASFKEFAGDLLVGNFGDGKINAFDPKTGKFVGQLMGKNGPIQIDGLWGLKLGNGGNAGNTDTLFFTAGIPGLGGNVEDHGLFGSLTVVPEPDSALLLAAGLGLLAAMRLRKRRPV
jgi:uncharacterized protein (TIGR03118 family)